MLKKVLILPRSVEIGTGTAFLIEPRIDIALPVADNEAVQAMPGFFPCRLPYPRGPRTVVAQRQMTFRMEGGTIAG
jgi:hypothetical protein